MKKSFTLSLDAKQVEAFKNNKQGSKLSTFVNEQIIKFVADNNLSVISK